jgi:hypothetical protein
VRRFGTAKAAPKRYQQDDFQHVQQGSNCWKVPTAGDIQREQQQKAGSNSDSESSSSGSSDADSESDIAEAADESRSSRGGSRGGSALGGTFSGASQPEFWVSHTKPRKPRKAKQEGPAARIVLT